MRLQQRVTGLRNGMAALALAAVLSACTVDKAGCDPAAMRHADFFSRIACDVSGSYDARAEDQKLALEQAQQNQKQLQQALLDLEAQQRTLSQGLTVEKARRDKLVKSLNATIAQSKQLSGQNAALQQQILKTQAEVDRLNTMPASVTAAQQQARLSKVQQEVEALKALLP